jgi:hypothetical protein
MGLRVEEGAMTDGRAGEAAGRREDLAEGAALRFRALQSLEGGVYSESSIQFPIKCVDYPASRTCFDIFSLVNVTLAFSAFRSSPTLSPNLAPLPSFSFFFDDDDDLRNRADPHACLHLCTTLAHRALSTHPQGFASR